MRFPAAPYSPVRLFTPAIGLNATVKDTPLNLDTCVHPSVIDAARADAFVQLNTSIA